MHTQAIADKLSISEGTAKLHLQQVYYKLDVERRVGLMQYLQRRGLA